MKLSTLHENKNLQQALKVVRDSGSVNALRITRVAKEYAVPSGLLGSALSNRVHSDYDLFANWWSAHRNAVDWPQYHQMMTVELPQFKQDATPLDNIPLSKVEPPAQPTSSAFQSAPNKHMNRG